jgi:hypothetical protein
MRSSNDCWQQGHPAAALPIGQQLTSTYSRSSSPHTAMLTRGVASPRQCAQRRCWRSKDRTEGACAAPSTTYVCPPSIAAAAKEQGAGMVGPGAQQSLWGSYSSTVRSGRQPSSSPPAIISPVAQLRRGR